MRNFCCIAVSEGPFAVPTLKNSLSGQFDLLDRILGKIKTGFTLKDFFKFLGNRFPVFKGQVRVTFYSSFQTGLGDDLLKKLIRDPHYHAPKHLHQTAVGIISEAPVTGQICHPLDHFIIHTDVENSVHHTGHRKFSAGPTGDQQGVRWVAELFADFIFYNFDRFQFLLPHPFRELFARSQVSVTCLRGHRKSWRDRQTDSSHFSQIGTFTTQ